MNYRAPTSNLLQNRSFNSHSDHLLVNESVCTLACGLPKQQKKNQTSPTSLHLQRAAALDQDKLDFTSLQPRLISMNTFTSPTRSSYNQGGKLTVPTVLPQDSRRKCEICLVVFLKDVLVSCPVNSFKSSITIQKLKILSAPIHLLNKNHLISLSFFVLFTK